jgi:hypothetical protein
VSNNPSTFGIQVKVPQQGYQKVASNLDFGSTHIIEPQDLKYPQQFGL